MASRGIPCTNSITYFSKHVAGIYFVKIGRNLAIFDLQYKIEKISNIFSHHAVGLEETNSAINNVCIVLPKVI